jgi:hypothetical protein
VASQSNTLITGVNEYFSSTKHPMYAVLSVFPILLFYEIIALNLNQNQEIGIRNAADVILRNIIFNELLKYTNLHGLFIYGFVALLLLALIFWQGNFKKNPSFKPRFFSFMFIESLAYAVAIGPFIGMMTQLVQHNFLLTQAVYSLSFAHKVMLSLGAGFYEELFFRLILLTGTAMLLIKILHYKKMTAYVISALFSSVLFSVFHYIGPFGEPFEIYSFVFRGFAGLLFSVLFYFRGFGIAVYTHTLYDLLVILNQ